MKAAVYDGPKNVSVDEIAGAETEPPTEELVKTNTRNICRPAYPRGSYGGHRRILAASALRTAASGHVALTAVAAAIGVHLLGGRRTLFSVGPGTLTYVVRANIL